MPLRLEPAQKQTAKIDPAFIEQIKKITETHIKELLARIDFINSTNYENETSFKRAVIAKQVQEAQNQLRMYRKTESGMQARRGGIEYQITQLKRQPYEFFSVKQDRDETWMIGQTIAFETGVTTGNYKGIYSHGPYLICVPSSSFGTLHTNRIHILPEQDIDVTYRHMHHMSSHHDSEKPALHRDTSTCWGAFASLIPSLLEQCDVAGLFSHLNKYASDINPSDALVMEHSLPHTHWSPL
jgi:hypothetical protein